MIRRCHRVISLGDFAVGADEHRHPQRIRFFIRRCAICKRHRLIFIAQEIVRRFELFFEFLIGILRIATDPQDNRIFLLEVLDSITESVALDRSARGIGFGVPPKQNVLPGERSEIGCLAVLIRQGKCRSRIANFYECHIYAPID